MYQNGYILKLSIGQKGENRMQKKLILLLKEKNITQRKLAEIIGISEKQMTCKIKGKTNFLGDEMFAISDFFKLPIEEIFLPSLYQNGTNKKEE